MNPLSSIRKVFNHLIPFVLLLALLGFLTASVFAQPTKPMGEPAVEWLKFQVSPKQQARFIEQDKAIWTPVLASYPGFQSKEIWTNPDTPNELIIVTHWESFDRWQAIPKEVLSRTTQKFHQAMGKEYVPESKRFRLAWRFSSKSN